MLQHFSKSALFLSVLIILLIKILCDDSEIGAAPTFHEDLQFDDKHPKILPDMLINPLSFGRSRLRSGLWTKNGIIFLYSKAYFDYHVVTCSFGLAIKLIKFYSCIPVYGFEISRRCALSDKPLDCARKPAVKGDEIDSHAAMVQEGVLKEMQAAEDYVIFVNDGVQCASHLGRIGGKQELWMIGHGSCMNAGTVIHEMIHALGYTHEHSRVDRDDYITIYEDNIQDSVKSNFRKVDAKNYEDFGPYDYLSLMHYDAYSGSKQLYKLFTMYPKNESVLHLMGQHHTLRMGDKIKIRSVTQCPETTYDEHLQAVLDLQSTQNLYTGEHTRLGPIIIMPCKGQ